MRKKLTARFICFLGFVILTLLLLLNTVVLAHEASQPPAPHAVPAGQGNGLRLVHAPVPDPHNQGRPLTLKEWIVFGSMALVGGWMFWYYGDPNRIDPNEEK